jgi:4-hydroxybenzoate polyprenyltransferase
MNQFKIFLELARLNKPIGFMLLFWPCSWGLALAFNSNHNPGEFIYFLILFFLGSVLMRSAGCIVNDIVDRDLDKKVRRTKNRPIASNIMYLSFSYINSV